MGSYLAAFIIAGIIAYASTPGILWLSRKIGAVDIPDDRKVHAAPTPTLGGAAIFLAFAGSFVVAAWLRPFDVAFRPFIGWPPTVPMGIAFSTCIVFALGVLDDLKGGLSVPPKLAGQVLAAGVVFISGVRLEFLRIPGREEILTLDLNSSAIVTIFWIVIIVNAVNLIDGLDGLAAGITGIAALTFFIYTYQVSQGLADFEQHIAPLLSIIITGACVGFLRYNFNPAKIFMGDSGSYTMGFLLAVATVIGVGRSTQNPIPESLLFYLPMLIPVIVLAIPILDTLLAIMRRAARGRHPFHADKQHLHHRLLELGHGHRQAVLIMYAWTGVIAALMLTFSFVANRAFQLVLAVIALVVLVYTMLPRFAR